MIECHMKQETLEQPGLLRSEATKWARAASEALEKIGTRDNLTLVGRGSSGNACTFAAYLYGMRRGRQAIEFRPWLSTQPSGPAKWDDANVFAYSASGQSTDIAHSAQWLKARGARVLGITTSTDPDSNLARASDALLTLDVGPERAVPATKSFAAQLFATAALCDFPLQPSAEEVAASMEWILSSGIGARLADFIEHGRNVVWVARGPALAAAQDAALKLQEAVGLSCQAWSAAEILHGPIGALDSSDRVVLFQDSHDPAESLNAVSTALLARGTPHHLVTELDRSAADDRPHVLGDLALRIPMPKERWPRAVVLAFLSQLCALILAERRGINPDRPQGLQKVTLT